MENQSVSVVTNCGGYFVRCIMFCRCLLNFWWISSGDMKTVLFWRIINCFANNKLFCFMFACFWSRRESNRISGPYYPFLNILNKKWYVGKRMTLNVKCENFPHNFELIISYWRFLLGKTTISAFLPFEASKWVMYILDFKVQNLTYVSCTILQCEILNFAFEFNFCETQKGFFNADEIHATRPIPVLEIRNVVRNAG